MFRCSAIYKCVRDKTKEGQSERERTKQKFYYECRYIECEIVTISRNVSYFSKNMIGNTGCSVI